MTHNNLGVKFNSLEISPGKRAKYSKDKCSKRSKLVEDNVEESNFVKASKYLSQTEHSDTLKRLKLLYTPKCSICVDSSSTSRQTMPSIVLTMFQNEMRLNTWYEAIETCYYWITPTQYLPQNVLRGIVEIMLNAHNDITTPYSIKHILNNCQQVLAYNFDMHPPCKAHADIKKCYNDFLTCSMDYKVYSNRSDFGHSNGIVKYCFNRLEDEIISTKSSDKPLYDDDFKKRKYTEIYKDERKETLHRLNWEQQSFEIYEMFDRSERIDRLMLVLESIGQLIQMDIFTSVGSAARSTLLQTLCSKENNSNKLKMQIMKLFAYSIHLDCPEEHIKVLTLWFNTFVQMIYFNSGRAYPLSSPDITNIENDFYKIISKLPHQSVIKILEKIEPPCFKHLICRRNCHNILSVDDHNVINIIINFLNDSKGKDYEDFIPTKKYNIQQTDVLNHLTAICKSVNHKQNNKNNAYPKFSKIKHTGEITDSEIIQVLYITLVALLEAYYIPKISVLDLNNMQSQMNLIDAQLQMNSNDALELENQYREIYHYRQILIGLLQSNELPKCFECFRILEKGE